MATLGASAGTTPEPSAAEWVLRLRRRQCSARELAEHCLARIEAVNEELNAVVARSEELTLSEAEEADRRIEAGEHGPLLGLPLTVKDSIEVAGLPCRGGSHAREDHIPSADATVVSRLRSAGAVILGKTNLPELSSSFETNNAIHGRTNNPLDVERTPGGSSGGEAAIIAADASPAGIGADGGGSIRVPSHFCGIVGLRPTTGRVPETGHWPPWRGGGMLDLLCVGPMARYVDDLALLLGVIHGPDGVDPFAPPVALGDPASVDLGRLRVGWYVEDGLARPTEGTAGAVEAAAAALAEAGCRVEEVTPPPGAREATELFFAAAGTEATEMRRIVEPAGGRHHPQFAAFLEAAPESPPTVEELFEVHRRIFDFRARARSFLEDYDVVLCPVAAGPAPPHDRPPGRHDDSEYMAYEGFNYVHTWALTGAPALSVPVSREQDLPVGAQVVAQPWREDRALAAGAVLEGAIGGYAGVTAGHLKVFPDAEEGAR